MSTASLASNHPPPHKCPLPTLRSIINRSSGTPGQLTWAITQIHLRLKWVHSTLQAEVSNSFALLSILWIRNSEFKEGTHPEPSWTNASSNTLIKRTQGMVPYKPRNWLPFFLRSYKPREISTAKSLHTYLFSRRTKMGLTRGNRMSPKMKVTESVRSRRVRLDMLRCIRSVAAALITTKATLGSRRMTRRSLAV